MNATAAPRVLEGTIRSRRSLAAFLRGDSTRHSFRVAVVDDDLPGRLRKDEASLRDWYNEHAGHVSGCTIADLDRLDAIRVHLGGSLTLTSYS